MRIDLTEKEFTLLTSRKAAFDTARGNLEIAQVMTQQASNAMSQHAQAFAELVAFFSPVENSVLGPLDQVKVARDPQGFYAIFQDQKPLPVADPDASVKIPAE